MSGFDPVGSSPVASVPAGSGVFATYELGRANLAYAGYTLTVTISVPPPRTSWIGAETLHDGAGAARESWIGAETLHDGAGAARESWIGLEVLRSVSSGVSDDGFVYLIC